MGNSASLIEENANEQLEYFIKEGLLNDELVQLYRNGTMTSNEIKQYIVQSIEKNNSSKKK